MWLILWGHDASQLSVVTTTTTTTRVDVLFCLKLKRSSTVCRFHSIQFNSSCSSFLSHNHHHQSPPQIVFGRASHHPDLLAQFLQEHTILVSPQRKNNDSSNNNNNNNNNNDNDGQENEENLDDVLLEPTAGDETIRRVPCYASLLQRIKDRRYFTDGPDGSQNKTFVVEVPLDEIVEWDGVRGGDLAERATKNTLRYAELFCSVLDRSLENMTPSSDCAPARDSMDILHEQRLQQQERMEQSQQQQRRRGDQAGGGNGDVDGGLAQGGLRNDGAAQIEDGNGNGEARLGFPPVLMRRYEVRVLPRGRRGVLYPFDRQHFPKSRLAGQAGAQDGLSLRHVRSRSIGRLVTITGMIVRASDVKPSCVVATFTCDGCGDEIYQEVGRKREFLPTRVCPQCGSDALHLQTRGSRFCKFQELKLQELPNQVPMGHVPRSMTIHCSGELTRLASPGDVVTIDGIFLPQKMGGDGGWGRSNRSGLITMTFVDAQNVVVHKKSFDESSALSQEEAAVLANEVRSVAHGEDPLGALSGAIAPEIFGHDDIKRSLLLQLVGGCTRKLPDGMRIRGDINICLMGDPGVAKSQLLKHVASIAPRGVYTTGKGSSGVGLTAAVTKDSTTGELALEGGALVLADRGICAIDEFDKMDEADRTAIHEVMEQQTVSIAKAGIVASLNARAAVLAAANPLYGRYNRKKTLSENVNLPNSLLSRFDLMFLILDTADVDRDIALARHVTFVHQNEGLAKKQNDDDGEGGDGEGGDGENVERRSGVSLSGTAIIDDDNDNDDNDIDDGVVGVHQKRVTPRVLREYIAQARKFNPIVPPDVAPYIVEAYVQLRLQDRPGARGGHRRSGDQTVMTARQLLSILRLAQALARLRFSDTVAREDVDEAIRLTHQSKGSLSEDDDSGVGGSKYGGSLGGTKRKREDVTSRIFTTIRDYASASQSTEVEMKLCEAMVLRKGFTAEQLRDCLDEYEDLDIVQVNKSRTTIYFLNE